jgi:conjugal transfer pilus assembly protein TraW
VALLAGWPLAGAAAEEGVDQALRAIRDQARLIDDQVREDPMPPWLTAQTRSAKSDTEQVQDLAEQASAIAQSAREPLEGKLVSGADGDVGPAVRFTLFASRSLGDGQLRDLFAFAAGQPETRVLFRGIGADESLLDFLGSLRPLLAGLDPPPNVLLDPTPFRAQAVTSVPTIVATAPDGSELARVSGLADTRWLRAALRAGQRGDLGARGPVREITEPDLLAEIRRRLARIDFTALGQRVVERAFQHLPCETLPTAGEDRERFVDPTIVAAADIPLADGTLLVHAGDAVNPLDGLPFTQRLVVLDAADSRQIAFAQGLASAGAAKRTTYLLTGLPHEDGWAALQRVAGSLDGAVYLLTPELRQRFALERVPSVVEADGRRFRVTETAMTAVVSTLVAPPP